MQAPQRAMASIFHPLRNQPQIKGGVSKSTKSIIEENSEAGDASVGPRIEIVDTAASETAAPTPM